MKKYLLFFLFLINFPCHSFGPIGHRVVGQLAENHLSEAVKTKVEKLLGGQTLAMVSIWADQVRSDKNYAHTSDWHYINIESKKKVSLNAVEGKAWQVINEQLLILKDGKKSPEKRAEALKWIVHIVADLHQPLHAGLSHDRGGNKISLPWFGKESNLHEIWDSLLLEFRQLSFSEQSDFLMRKITAEHKKKGLDKIEKWIEEDIALRDLVYSYPKSAKFKWEYDYIYRTKDILDDQLIKAGLRLAHLIESSLADEKK